MVWDVAWSRSRLWALVAILGVAVALGLLGASRSDASSGGGGERPHGGTVLTVGGKAFGRPIPDGFLGLSFEYWATEAYAGKNPRTVDPVLVQLIRNLMPDQQGVLRIGGVTTDWTWWPVKGMARPGGVNYTLTTRRLQVMGALAQEVGARLILGVNFEANSHVVASAEEQAMRKVIGSNLIEAFELGNEPELYSSFPWYDKPDGTGVVGRATGWDFSAFVNDYASVAGALGSAPLAGPTVGSVSWVDLTKFLATERHVAVVTLHRYPMWACFNARSSPTYPTIANMLSEAASGGLADSLAPYVAIAHADHLPLRNDEMNSVSCGNGYGVANVFGSALWSIDALFQMARVGVDGVNIHTAPVYPDRLFTTKRVHSRWQAVVAPEYYGLLMFSQAAPAGARLLPVSGAPSEVRAWATQARGGQIHVVLINDDTAHARTLALRIDGANGAGTLERLLAPSVHATRGVTLAGQGFGVDTTTGALEGPSRTALVNPRAGEYVVRLPATSAAMLTLASK